MYKRAIVVILMLLISSCSFIPEYKRPNMPVQDSFPENGIYKNISYKNETDIPKIRWQDFIKDEKLKEIVKIALKKQ